MLRGEFHLVLIAASQREQRDTAEGRVFQLLAELDFLFVKSREIVAAGKLNGRMKGRECLYEHFAFDVAPPGAPGDLGEQLKRPLAGAKIRLMQRQIGVNDAHQRDVREMQPLR